MSRRLLVSFSASVHVESDCFVQLMESDAIGLESVFILE